MAENPAIEEHRKVGFDQRLKYFENLGEIMLIGKKADMAGELKVRYKAVKQAAFMISAYIKRSEYEEIKTHLDIAARTLKSNVKGGYKGYLHGEIEEELNHAEELLHEYGREIFLPVGGAEGQEPDFDRMMRDS